MLGVVLRPAAAHARPETAAAVRAALARWGVPLAENDEPLDTVAAGFALPPETVLELAELDDATLGELAAAYARAALHLRSLLREL